jgi:hypothetical protein
MKSYDRIAPFYDEDMGRNNNGNDTTFLSAGITRSVDRSWISNPAALGRISTGTVDGGFTGYGLRLYSGLSDRWI